MFALLDGVRKDYAWGSTSSIPGLMGVPEDGRPWAELWFGAHSSAPATLGPSGAPLDSVIAADPARHLGPTVHERFGELPFLVKFLAAEAPLSLQAHPSTEQACAGFDREDAAGIPVDAPHRSFRDRHHKPELICALTDFTALCGFRALGDTLELLGTVETSALDPIRRRLSTGRRDALAVTLDHLLNLEAEEATDLVGAVVDGCRSSRAASGRREREMAVDLATRYPGDAGVVTALLLNLVTLRPGEALFLEAGNLHAYLSGTGIEVMANSDNVLRGGLTTKHVDVPVLLDVVDATPVEPRVQKPPVHDGVAQYDTPVPEFSLRRVEIEGSRSVLGGPAVLICTGGAVTVDGQSLPPGRAGWVSADEGRLAVAGRGTLYRVGSGLH